MIQSDTYSTIAQAIEYIRQQAAHQPSLEEVALAVGLSEYHLQRTFRAWAGVSPKRFLQFLTKEHALSRLHDCEDLLTVSLGSGLSGPGRLHDLMVSCEAMTPGEIKLQGAGMTIEFGLANSPFGRALAAWTDWGVCHLAFIEPDPLTAHDLVSACWPRARLVRNDPGAGHLMSRIFPQQASTEPVHLLLKGTNFQIKVWEALLGVGSAQVTSYAHLARLTGQPRAHRSVGTALAANRLAYLIPCHRVIRGNGEVGVYHWGSTRKLAMLAWESAQADSPKR